MRIGILSDIHEAIIPLQNALDLLERERVDRILLLGDLFEVGKRLEETIALLQPFKVIGVWGNHDWGLCGEVLPKIRARFSDSVFEFMQRLQPRIELENCFFQHIEPWLDPTDIQQLWGWFEPFDISERFQKSFAAVADPRMFMGHLHRWFAATPEGILPWKGETPLDLKRHPRSLVVIHAVMMGYGAIYDTQSEILWPFTVPGAEDFVGENR